MSRLYCCIALLLCITFTSGKLYSISLGFSEPATIAEIVPSDGNILVLNFLDYTPGAAVVDQERGMAYVLAYNLTGNNVTTNVLLGFDLATKALKFEIETDFGMYGFIFVGYLEMMALEPNTGDIYFTAPTYEFTTYDTQFAVFRHATQQIEKIATWNRLSYLGETMTLDSEHQLLWTIQPNPLGNGTFLQALSLADASVVHQLNYNVSDYLSVEYDVKTGKLFGIGFYVISSTDYELRLDSFDTNTYEYAVVQTYTSAEISSFGLSTLDVSDRIFYIVGEIGFPDTVYHLYGIDIDTGDIVASTPAMYDYQVLF